MLLGDGNATKRLAAASGGYLPRMLSPIVKGCLGHVHKIELAQAITGNPRHRTAQSCLNPQISFDVANFVLIGVTFSV